jgi:hypothetical protein
MQMRLRRIRPNAQCVLKRLDGRLGAVLAQLGCAQIVMGRGVVGGPLQQLLQGMFSVPGLAVLEQELADVIVVVHVFFWNNGR